MRNFLARENIRKAALFSAIITVACYPQITKYAVLTSEPTMTIAVMVAGCFLGMNVVCGMVLAWSKRDGLSGWCPELKIQLKWLGIALGLAVILSLFHKHFDPVMKYQASQGDFAHTLFLHYPQTFKGCLSLSLWAAAFEAMFFTAGAMSFFVRISGRVWVGMGMCLILRYAVNMTKLAEAMPPSILCVIFLAVTTVSLLSCLLFARGGVFPMMFFHACLAFRHLLGPDQ